MGCTVYNHFCQMVMARAQGAVKSSHSLSRRSDFRANGREKNCGKDPREICMERHSPLCPADCECGGFFYILVNTILFNCSYLHVMYVSW